MAFLLLLTSFAVPAAQALATSTAITTHQVRLARREELWPIALLLDDSFAANAAQRPPWEALVAQGRLALDLERRLTPWDWCRHHQFVAEEAGTGRIIGFAELWAENAAMCGDDKATTPQPVVFNLCVAQSARRRGVASQLLSQCEVEAARWGEPSVFLKVEVENNGAIDLYRRCGFETLGGRDPAEMEEWMARWKGGRRPLALMRKPVECARRVESLAPSPSLGGGPSSAAPAAADTPRFSELEVSFDQVRGYEARGAGGQAYLWFCLLVLRNAKQLSPIYGAVGGGSAVMGLLTYTLFAEFARNS